MKAEDLRVEWVPLEAIQRNPWQVRIGEDASAVQALARDIAERGLLQFPVARRVETGQAQLAFGHTRLAAFQLLAATDHGADYATMPLVIRELGDQEMAEFAISENFQRKDLTPIEKARALKRYCQDFGKTQAEAGERFGLSQSAVSHLMRLLELPDQVQELVGKGELPERFARQLVAVAAAAPEKVVEAAQVIAAAPSEEREDSAAIEIGAVYRDLYQQLQRWKRVYKWPEEPMDVSGSARPKKGEPTTITGCAVCEFRTEFDGLDYCTRPACYKLKKRLLAAQLKAEREKEEAKRAKAAGRAAESAEERKAREEREKAEREEKKVECWRLLGAAIEGIVGKLPKLEQPYLDVLMVELDASNGMFIRQGGPDWVVAFSKLNDKELIGLKPADKLRYTQALLVVHEVWDWNVEPAGMVKKVERLAAGWKVKLAQGWELKDEERGARSEGRKAKSVERGAKGTKKARK